MSVPISRVRRERVGGGADGYAPCRRWFIIPAPTSGPVPVITDAAPSADDQLRTRRRRYTVLMAIHLVGLAVGGALHERA